MNKQEFENKYRIFKEVEAFFQSLENLNDEQISTQFALLSDEAQEKVLKLTDKESDRRNK